MSGLSLRQAATEAGTSKSTILRAIQAGRLSATRTDDGGYSIDPAELFRVYPPKRDGDDAQRSTHHGEGQGATVSGPDAMVELRVRNASLEARVEALQVMLEAEKRRAEEVRDDMEHWRAQAERLALPSPPAVQPSQSPEPAGLGSLVARWWLRKAS